MRSTMVPVRRRPQLDNPIRAAVHEENDPIAAIGELDTRPISRSPRELGRRGCESDLPEIIDIETVGRPHDHRGRFVAHRRSGLEPGDGGPDQTGGHHHEDDGDEFPCHALANRGTAPEISFNSVVVG